METNALRAHVRQAARTLLGAQVWPNGLGFDIGTAQITPDESTDPPTWYASTETHQGHGQTPAKALAALVPQTDR